MVPCFQVVTYHTTLVLLTACFLGSPNDVWRDDAAVCFCDSTFFHLARHALLDQMP